MKIGIPRDYIFSVDLVAFDQLPDSIHNHRGGQMVTYNETVLAIGGEVTAQVEHLLQNTWEQSDIPPVGNVNIALTDFSALMINNNIIIFGGYRWDYYRRDVPTNAVWSFTNQDTVWTRKTLLRRPRTYHTSAFLNGQIYHFGGCYYSTVKCDISNSVRYEQTIFVRFKTT